MYTWVRSSLHWMLGQSYKFWVKVLVTLKIRVKLHLNDGCRYPYGKKDFYNSVKKYLHWDKDRIYIWMKKSLPWRSGWIYVWVRTIVTLRMRERIRLGYSDRSLWIMMAATSEDKENVTDTEGGGRLSQDLSTLKIVRRHNDRATNFIDFVVDN